VATTVLFVGSIFNPWVVVWAAIPLAIALIGWFWPRQKETEEHLMLERSP
jgi:cytochrome c oxidase subunit I+III